MQGNDIVNLVTPFKDKLFRLALRIVGSVQEAEDVIQEVLVKVWKKKEVFLDLDNKEAWCMTVTRNLCIDKIRARKMRTTDVTEHYNIRDKTLTPAQEVVSNDRMSQILELINALPEKQKTVVQLRDIEGYSYKEISEITTLKLDQVKVYLHRARITLRAQITKRAI
jgi:RNA polymerase sigma-70 factor (ECF subfamily)